MKLSYGPYDYDLRYFTPVVVSFKEFKKLILKNNYSFGVFHKSTRNIASFKYAEAIGLDFDDGLTLNEAKKSFREYKHIIATTRNHQKLKNGKVADRFRVILFLSKPIEDAGTFSATWHYLAEKWPQRDGSCKDPSRLWYPSRQIVQCNVKGKLVDPVPYVAPEKGERVEINLPPGMRGRRSRSTIRFMNEGADTGERHHRLFKAAIDYKEQGFTEDEFIADLEVMVEKCDGITWPHEGHEKTIRDVFERITPKYEPRMKKNAFDLVPIGKLYKSKSEMKWLVRNFLSEAGVSLITGDPKAGKSTIIRQLIRSVLRGEKFLGRKCKKGSVWYLGIEEQQEIINASFNRLGIKSGEQLYVHVGSPLTEHAFDDLERLLCENDNPPALAVIDTLFDVLEVESENNYKEVKNQLRRLRFIARQSGTHILGVHHNNKGIGSGIRNILGSTAISGGVDTIILFNKSENGKTRLITTEGRGIKKWDGNPLVYDSETETYKLGRYIDGEDDY